MEVALKIKIDNAPSWMTAEDIRDAAQDFIGVHVDCNWNGKGEMPETTVTLA